MTDGSAARAASLLRTWDRSETSRQSVPTTVWWDASLRSCFSTWSLPLPRQQRGVRVVRLKTPYLSLLRLPVVHSGDGSIRPRAPQSPLHALWPWLRPSASVVAMPVLHRAVGRV